jgi:formamidopyrimidine-DNA glycosylase
MPELPEVETLVSSLRPLLTGRTILSADLRWRKSLAKPAPARFIRWVTGQQVADVSRRGKFFILNLSSAYLLIHLRMSGDLQLRSGRPTPGKHDRLLLYLSDDSSFVFCDPRKFGRIWLVDDPLEVLSGLGPEPLSDDFTTSWLFQALHLHRRQLKPLLLDQHFIAGLGNIYTDEALHRAKLHPLTVSAALTEPQVATLWQSIRDTLQEGIRRNGSSIDWVYRGGDFQNQFSVYGRQGQSCPVCGAVVQRILVGQRGTHFCPSCQEIQYN